MSDAVTFQFQELEPPPAPPRDAAARLLARAMAEADEIRESARAHGYAEGHAAGLADGERAAREAADAFTEAARAIGDLQRQVTDAVERDAVEMALSLAAKILGGTLEARPEAVVDVVQGALRRLTDRRGITVLVNPSDLETVGASIGDLQSSAKGLELCDLQGDQRVPSGGAVVSTSEGEIDAGVETQLERAREVIASELRGGPS